MGELVPERRDDLRRVGVPAQRQVQAQRLAVAVEPDPPRREAEPIRRRACERELRQGQLRARRERLQPTVDRRALGLVGGLIASRERRSRRQAAAGPLTIVASSSSALRPSASILWRTGTHGKGRPVASSSSGFTASSARRSRAASAGGRSTTQRSKTKIRSPLCANDGPTSRSGAPTSGVTRIAHSRTSSSRPICARVTRPLDDVPRDVVELEQLQHRGAREALRQTHGVRAAHLRDVRAAPRQDCVGRRGRGRSAMLSAAKGPSAMRRHCVVGVHQVRLALAPVLGSAAAQCVSVYLRSTRVMRATTWPSTSTVIDTGGPGSDFAK